MKTAKYISFVESFDHRHLNHSSVVDGSLLEVREDIALRTNQLILPNAIFRAIKVGAEEKLESELRSQVEHFLTEMAALQIDVHQ